MEEEQAAIPASTTPKLTIKSIAEKMALLDREVMLMLNLNCRTIKYVCLFFPVSLF